MNAFFKRLLTGGILPLLLSSLTFAQAPLSLPLQSKGEIPEIFCTTSTQKYRLQVQESDVSTSELSKKAQKNFYLETNFGLDQLLRSGLVTYGDEISLYLQEIADILLKDQPALRSELRFFAIYSPFPNAFATQRGSIFVNMGLIARMNTEAQLAFILCHEISHYLEQHSLTKYVEYSDNLWQDRSYRKATNQEKLLIRNNFSQQQEIEADSLGYQLFKNSPYGTSSIEEVFDILDHAEEIAGYADLSPGWLSSLAFDQDQIDTILFLQGPSVANKLKTARYLSPDGTSIETPDSEDHDAEEVEAPEESGTHPSPQKRKALFLSWVAAESSPEGASFVFPVERFLTVQRIARLETASGFLYKRLPLDALLTIRWLETEGETDEYLQRLKLMALFQFSMMRNKRKVKPSTQEASIQLMDTELWTKQLRQSKSNLQLAVISSYGFDFYQADTVKNAWARPYLASLFKEGAESIPRRISTNYFQQVIDQYSNSPLFNKLYEEAQKEYEKEEEWDEYIRTEDGKKKVNEWTRDKEKNGYALGIDSILVFSPEFVRIRSTKRKQKMFWVESEQLQIRLSESIGSIGNESQGHILLLDPHNYSLSTSSDIYNQSTHVQRWIDQVLEQDDENFVPYNQPEVEEIFLRQGITHVAIAGAFSVKTFNKNFLAALLLGGPFTLATPPVWPIIWYQILKKKENGLVYLVLMDIESSSIVFKTLETPDFRVNQHTASHYIEYMIGQLQRKP